jgi:two-component system, response regulator, stage 0 sporulation protein F
MKKILIVDDDAHIRDLLKTELEDDGYRVSTASQGKEAITLLAGAEKPDLIIMDIRMPQMDGLETIGNILKLKVEIPIVIHSAYRGYQNDYLSMIADAYVVKSSDLSELKKKVHELTEG